MAYQDEDCGEYSFHGLVLGLDRFPKLQDDDFNNVGSTKDVR